MIGNYLLRRLWQGLFLLIGVVFITFILIYVLPSDPARMIAGRSATAQSVEHIREQLGLNLPLWEQYLRYLWRLMHGNLGRSYIQRVDVSMLIGTRLWPTMQLMFASIGFELVIGLTAGILAALRPRSAMDRGTMLMTFIGVSSPQFVVGIILLYVFSMRLGWFPMGGYGGWKNIILPALSLGFLGSGWYSRVMRSEMMDALRQDYIRTARAKGAGAGRIVLVHALRNAVLPIITMIGMDIGYFMSGVVVVESVFGWPGIGQLMWQAIQNVDAPVIMGVTLVAATAIILGSLLADIFSLFVDPMIRLR
ncbi:glutathione transport system permease protein GsiC [mine drainage metagenome]|uniref:Glutathione transport system permease protein GsiC n=1 Tax=mine drainage metagenome TaxID=410659 RepID=A0A1J5QM10_9ZZZZ